MHAQVARKINLFLITKNIQTKKLSVSMINVGKAG